MASARRLTPWYIVPKDHLASANGIVTFQRRNMWWLKDSPSLWSFSMWSFSIWSADISWSARANIPWLPQDITRPVHDWCHCCSTVSPPTFTQPKLCDRLLRSGKTIGLHLPRIGNMCSISGSLSDLETPKRNCQRQGHIRRLRSPFSGRRSSNGKSNTIFCIFSAMTYLLHRYAFCSLSCWLLWILVKNPRLIQQHLLRFTRTTHCLCSI